MANLRLNVYAICARFGWFATLRWSFMRLKRQRGYVALALAMLFTDRSERLVCPLAKLVRKVLLLRAIWGELNKAEIASLGAVFRVGEMGR